MSLIESTTGEDLLLSSFNINESIPGTPPNYDDPLLDSMSIVELRELLIYRIDILKNRILIFDEANIDILGNHTDPRQWKSFLSFTETHIRFIQVNEIIAYLQHLKYIEDLITKYIPYKRKLSVIKKINPFLECSHDCCICFEFKQTHKFCETNCNHKICVSCIICLIKSFRKKTYIPLKCPLCRSDILTLKCYHDSDIQLIHNYL